MWYFTTSKSQLQRWEAGPRTSSPAPLDSGYELYLSHVSVLFCDVDNSSSYLGCDKKNEPGSPEVTRLAEAILRFLLHLNLECSRLEKQLIPLSGTLQQKSRGAFLRDRQIKKGPGAFAPSPAPTQAYRHPPFKRDQSWSYSDLSASFYTEL
jgi:hypothetical protein